MRWKQISVPTVLLAVCIKLAADSRLFVCSKPAYYLQQI